MLIKVIYWLVLLKMQVYRIRWIWCKQKWMPETIRSQIWHTLTFENHITGICTNASGKISLARVASYMDLSKSVG